MLANTLLPLAGLSRMKYETPPQGISITAYIVRRMHKTRLLKDIEDLAIDDTQLALSRVGVYAAAAGTSWGPALYQPRFDSPGTTISEADPETGALITVKQIEGIQNYAFVYEVQLPDGGRLVGNEKILGTTVGFRGLGMPAPSRFEFTNANGTYQATATGIIHSELAPGLGQWKVRGYGDLQLEDNQGNRGFLQLDRDGKISIQIQSETGEKYSQTIQLQ